MYRIFRGRLFKDLFILIHDFGIRTRQCRAGLRDLDQNKGNAGRPCMDSASNAMAAHRPPDQRDFGISWDRTAAARAQGLQWQVVWPSCSCVCGCTKRIKKKIPGHSSRLKSGWFRCPRCKYVVCDRWCYDSNKGVCHRCPSRQPTPDPVEMMSGELLYPMLPVQSGPFAYQERAHIPYRALAKESLMIAWKNMVFWFCFRQSGKNHFVMSY